MPRVHHAKKARKARPEHEIEVGDEHTWPKENDEQTTETTTLPVPER